MLDWAGKKLEQLLDTLVEPVWKQVLALPWLGRAAVFVLCALSLAGLIHWQDIRHHLISGVRVLQIISQDNGHTIPLSVGARNRVNESIERLAFSLESDLASRLARAKSPDYGSWVPAQEMVALREYTASQGRIIVNFFRDRFDPTCPCWKEFPRVESPRHTLATAWVMTALGKLDSAPAPEAVRFLLDTQDADGWWPMFPSQGRPDYASTYTTCFVLLALNELAGRNLIDPGMLDTVTSSINRGGSWLISNRISGEARWWDYPHSGGKKVSDGLSGIVVYTLHRLGRIGFVELDRQWLRELPGSLPAADDCGERRQVWMDALDGPQVDAVCPLRLAWILAGTVDAYRNGTVREKAEATLWIERALDETDLLNSETIPEAWKRSEILISLRHLADNSIPQ